MDSGLRALLLGAGTVITCIVISLAFYITRGSRDTATSAFSNISKINAEFNESDKVMYDGLSVAGSEVINVINKYKNEKLSIVVRTKKSEINYGYDITGNNADGWELDKASTRSINNAKDIKDLAYINQSSQFTGEILRDKNNTITGIKFTQE